MSGKRTTRMSRTITSAVTAAVAVATISSVLTGCGGLATARPIDAATLRTMDLRGADMTGADLRWANMMQADVRDARLEDASFYGEESRGNWGAN